MSEKLNVCDEKTFKQIFKDHFKSLQNFFYYKYGDLDKAKDLMQDSFIKLWNNCKDVPYEKSKGYLFMLARNAFLNDLKRQKMILKHQNNANKNLLYIESPDYVLEEKEFLDKINREISLLPDNQRKVFLLNRIDEKTYKEIAEMLDISVKTVEKWMHDALVVLREKIGKI
ncbi:RNA polymerase sigma-70 factor, ECF subfamily [Zobellia uliginosa]|uniref:RNA polymerase sigma-70 factor, ECF subfamily n=1 Tax=Zobellia uliginosa TaxID=143224 RepID=A0ABY1L294_9FLAO|nr:sigma-70 family RNA polymerase sigma factor [Zobellia uliginosa]SIT16007.1 RNA polymerase sigma-70 factor, ECF subfamily [Zobellia uliginosa]